MTPDTTRIAPPRTSSSRPAWPTATAPATWRRTVVSELVKLSTLRSTRILLLSAGVCVVGLGLAEAIGVVVVGAATQEALSDPLKGCLNGIGVAQLLVLGLGVSAATSEYSTGTIASTLTAQPRRRVLAAAKGAAAGMATATVAALAVLTTYVANSLVLASHDSAPSWSTLEVWRALLGAVLYLTAVAMLGTAFGHLLRSTAAAYSAAAALLYLPALLVLLLPVDISAQVTRYTPANSGSALMQLHPGTLLPWLPALAVLLAYLLAFSAWAATRLAHHDV